MIAILYVYQMSQQALIFMNFQKNPLNKTKNSFAMAEI